MVVQPKNVESVGSICFGLGEPLRIDASVSKPLRARDVLVVNRGRFAAAVFEPVELGIWAVPSSILVLSVKDDSVLPEYVACYFNSRSGQELFRRHSEQTTIPFISAANLMSMDVPIPPLERQRALVAFEKAIVDYARMTNRKQDLHRQILSHELGPTRQSTTRRSR